MKVSAYAARAARSPLESFTYDFPKLGSQEIKIRVTHCGICHSDIHLIDNDWGMSQYPLVPGHEIIGTVEQVGSQVTHLKEGQRVGVGWQRGSCLVCEYCVGGDENLCADSKGVCVGQHGGFASHVCVDGRFAFPIPEALPSAKAAPLLCGGITVYAPLVHFQVTPETKVGVIGVGGLGHLALQFVRAYGCEVTAFSSSPDKEEEARKFGAHHFIASKDSAGLTKVARSQDFLLSTVSADLDWSAYLEVLRPDGKLCIVGAAPNPISIPVFPLIIGRKTICGSPIGGRGLMGQMLTFAARHGIAAQVEELPFQEVNQALAKVRENKARYRMVLNNPLH